MPTPELGFPPHERRSRGRESAPSLRNDAGKTGIPARRRAAPALILGALATGWLQAQPALFPTPRPQPRFPDKPNHSFYVNARYFVQQTGYEELWRRHHGHLPTGQGVVMAQVENGVADPAQFKDKRILFVPNFKPAANARGHENTTGRILYSSTPHADQQAVFEYGFSPGVTTVYAFTSDQFRKHVLKLPSHNTRGGLAPGWNGASVDVLNLSNTLGNGGEKNTVRSLDALIDTANVLAFTSQPGSLQRNESVAGVLWNALVVGKASPDLGYAEGAVFENVGLVPRPKPDLASASYIHRDGGASSWATPTVASGGAMLLERARATQSTQSATNNYVMKAIILAGATKTGLSSPV